MRFFALSVAILASIVAGDNDECNGPNAVTKPPPGAIVVDSSGKHSESFISISQAVNQLPDTTDQINIFMYPGVYNEQVFIPKLKGPLVLQGYTCNSMSYDNNQVTITQAMAQRDVPLTTTKSRDDLTSTFTIKTENVRVYNLNIENSAGKFDQDGQALAASVAGDKSSFYACNFTGYQDTLYTKQGRQLYAKSSISGAVDFIFGANAVVWFDSCHIPIVGPGAITANGRSDDSNPSIYVFNRAHVYSSGSGVRTGSSYLGRPWGPKARVVFQKSNLSDVINPAGWEKWSGNDDAANVYFGEYKNTGAGAAGTRVSFSRQLDAPIAITQVLGQSYADEWYVDKRYLSKKD